MILTVPKDDTLYPTLGPQVCDFIERNMVYGPGDLRGRPIVLGNERTALIYRFYEVYPKGHDLAGRRRFKRAGLSLAKGVAKTETAAIVAACELHPEAPVRCDGWTSDGEPIGRPVTDPYIPLVAYNEAQSSELAYAALKTILEEGPLRDDFLIGLERIERKRGDGMAVSLSSSPNARDGARTTFAVMDETHRWVLERLKRAHITMTANLGKRYLSDPWMLEVTTAPEPGARSVAEDTMDYARSVDQGIVHSTSFFFFHRQADDSHDLSTREDIRAAVIEASGEAAMWRDIDAIVGLWDDPTADKAYLERVYCNRLVKGSTQAFDVVMWKALAKPREVKRGALITLGLDGSQTRDSSALVATEVLTGYQWLAGLWERPFGAAGETWEVPTGEVDALVRHLFSEFDVWRFYCDPAYWQGWLAIWAGDPKLGKDRLGNERVIAWWTNRRKQMSTALENFQTSIVDGSLSHSGDERYTRHIGNSRKLELQGMRDEQGRPIWLIQKERPDSPMKIDAAVAGVLSWQARTDAVASGAARTPEFQMIVIGRGR
jgi:hypothetical protein